MEDEIVGKRTDQSNNLVVVTGGNGFIGSHVARHYHERGYRVRVVDVIPKSKLDDYDFFTERIIGNLCDISFCYRIVRGASIVLHFAAVMGGMGVIHADNDSQIYRTNHSVTQNLIECSLKLGVRTFFYASSACVYPNRLQGSSDSKDVSLAEDDVYGGLGERPDPQGLYGLEKLHSEQLLLRYATKINIQIARFHNVYGPRGSWDDGHEKAPAAFVRKAIALKLAEQNQPQFEIWGSGHQRRSFLYIDDAVRAVALLVDSSNSRLPINIGSNEAISIIDLAKLALETVELNTSAIEFAFRHGRPVGVASRNSDNTRIEHELNWRPEIDLYQGLERTADWMSTRIHLFLSNTDRTSRESYLASLMSSEIVDLATSDSVTFAILLPVTSRGASQTTCIMNLSKFAKFLQNSTWRDRNELGSTRYVVRIYLAIDDDDYFLLPPSPGSDGCAESILREHGFSEVVTIRCEHPRGHICALWRDCARRAFEDKCDYYILMGDDVELLDEGWMRTVHFKFAEIAAIGGGPHGLGCVSFTDISFPGMPTFPVLHQTHLEIFDGEVIPSAFINQDGDPYLFQLYRHFGASTTVHSRIRNITGGSGDARHEKHPFVGWTFDTLEIGKNKVARWVEQYAPKVEAKISLDVVVPSYRVNLKLLSKILELKPSSSCTTMFIIIVDDPHSPFIYELEHMYAHRMDVRIRINKTNDGASASRNRGLVESSAEWVAFLDDDVEPSLEYLVEAERYIRAYPNAAGFIGNTYFPVAPNIFTTAVHLAGVTYFWDIADKIEDDIPWGVTANMIVRRNIRDGVLFDLRFPKTGGGEDIDFCRQKRQASLDRGGTGFRAAPKAKVVHPWWNGGQRTYWRYYMWAEGDGGLIKKYPQLSWRDWSPNSAELILLSPSLVLLGLGLGNLRGGRTLFLTGVVLPVTTVFVNIFHDAYRHLVRDRARTTAYRTSVGGFGWTCAVFESGLIRMASEAGRMAGLFERREWGCVGKRFDWFCGNPNAVREERTNGMQRLGIIALSTALVVRYAFK